MSINTLEVTTPPGQAIDPSNVSVKPLNSEITFNFNSSSLKPLSPLVQVSYSPEGDLQVSAVVFIASSETPSLSAVNQESVISDSGETQLDFFIIYDAPEVSYQNFSAYRVDFIIENPPADLVQIETFLWDSDPVTSRGTVTPVGGGGD
ncbi:hypothetical protein DIS18_07490 [Algibacter marinivivus]|uniref:Uncharacterized protein n=1 Tax=Algibacter marinivivus TaxID=2100723 RepID=A0A2U2X9B8_9FLAO|nr:hypothetical protein [Algibacter marinivivus]PWH84369.1 hypothetical protein DIS18_07490 [Algibacter marinivivus]